MENPIDGKYPNGIKKLFTKMARYGSSIFTGIKITTNLQSRNPTAKILNCFWIFYIFTMGSITIPLSKLKNNNKKKLFREFLKMIKIILQTWKKLN